MVAVVLPRNMLTIVLVDIPGRPKGSPLTCNKTRITIFLKHAGKQFYFMNSLDYALIFAQ